MDNNITQIIETGITLVLGGIVGKILDAVITRRKRQAEAALIAAQVETEREKAESTDVDSEIKLSQAWMNAYEQLATKDKAIIQDLETRVGQLELHLETLINDNKKAAELISELGQQVRQLQITNDHLRGFVEQLQIDQQTLKDKITEQNAIIARQDTEIAALKDENRALKKRLKELEDINSTQRKTIEIKDGRIGCLENLLKVRNETGNR